MKKVLAVLLSVMMLFAALSFNSSAAPNYGYDGSDSLILTLRNTGVINERQVVFCFNLQIGTMYGAVPVYDKDHKTFTSTEGVTGRYYMIPDNSQALEGVASSNIHTAGTSIILPSVIAPEGKNFDGWEYINEKGDVSVCTAGSRFIIPKANYEANPDEALIYFEAVYSTAEIEGDIFAKIISVLITLVSDFLKPYGINLEELIGGIL